MLRGSGWRPKEVSAPELSISVRNSQPFVDGDGRECDLHWHVLHECCGTDEVDFWRSFVPAEVGGVKTRVLSPTDQLFHVCVHGARWEEFVPNVRWIPDAVKISTASAPRDRIDWTRLTALAAKYRLTLPLRDALAYLRDERDVAVPQATMRALHKTP